MGRRGPKSDPASVKEAKGNPSRRPIGHDPIEVDDAPATDAAGDIGAPDFLTEGGRKVWAELAPRLRKMKLLQPIDAMTFGRYCCDFAQWIDHTRNLEENGYTYEIETASGKVRRANPAFTMAERVNRTLIMVEAKFGLNPAERQSIFAARAAGSGAGGDLFDAADQSQKQPDEKPVEGAPIHGFLN